MIKKNSSTAVTFTADMPISLKKKEQFLANRQNKKKVYFMLSKALQLTSTPTLTNWETYHASGDADFLIVRRQFSLLYPPTLCWLGRIQILLLSSAIMPALNHIPSSFVQSPKNKTKTKKNNNLASEYQECLVQTYMQPHLIYLCTIYLYATQHLASMELRRDLPSKCLWQVHLRNCP